MASTMHRGHRDTTMMEYKIMHTLLDYIANLTRKGSTSGGEHAGPCPACGGEDRFRVWPDHSDSETGRFWCRQCKISGDGIKYLRQFEDYSFQDACKALGAAHKLSGDSTGRQRTTTRKQAKPRPAPSRKAKQRTSASSASRSSPVAPPSEEWQKAAALLCEEAQEALWSECTAAVRARRYLTDRGLTEDTIRAAGLGFLQSERYINPKAWGLPQGRGRIWVPRGIVIPWYVDGLLLKVSVRRPAKDVNAPDTPDQKYHTLKGSCGKVLYSADSIQVGRPAALSEGPFDALVIRQETDGIGSVATGSTGGARAMRWRVRLSLASVVLITYDAEDAGETGARYWMQALSNGVRWRPHDHDANDLLVNGGNVEEWIQRGVDFACGQRGGSHRAREEAAPTESDNGTRRSVAEAAEAPDEAPLPQPIIRPGDVPASLPVPDGGVVHLSRQPMQTGAQGIAITSPYNADFAADIKRALPQWAYMWDDDAKAWVVDDLFAEYVQDMLRHHYRALWQKKVYPTTISEVNAEAQRG